MTSPRCGARSLTCAPCSPSTGERLARIEAVVEATQTEHGERLARLEAGQGVLRSDLTATNERMTRIEGTVAAGPIGRPFPERMAQVPGVEADG